MKLRLAFLLSLCAASTCSALLWIVPSRFTAPGGGGPLVVSTAQNLASGTQTTTGIDTTGANLIVVVATSYLSSNTPTDNKGNTYTALTGGEAAIRQRMFYCASPTVGTGHTFTQTSGYGADLLVLAFSGMSSTPLDQQNYTESSGTSASSGSITTSQANTIIVTSASGYANAPSSVSGSITIQGSTGISAVGYKVLTATTTINPTWTFGSSQTETSAKVVSFKY